VRTVDHVTRTTQATSLQYLADEMAEELLAKLGNVPRLTISIAQPTPLVRAEVHVTRSKKVFPPYLHEGTPYVLENSQDTHTTKYSKITPSLQTPSMHRAILGVGSNINDRVSTINSALDLLAQLGSIIRISFLYESPAKYVEDQPDFLNLCLIIDTAHTAMELLRKIKSIEEQLGRAPVRKYRSALNLTLDTSSDTLTALTARNGPRVIDIDVLYYDSEVISKSVLVVPHPSIYERDFVLRPLAE